MSNLFYNRFNMFPYSRSSVADFPFHLLPPCPLLIRTHKAVCPCCKGSSETTDPNNRVALCFACNSMMVSKL
jgi:hypothetical protein